MFCGKNSNSDGNCLFSCIASGYNSENLLVKNKQQYLLEKKQMKLRMIIFKI